MKAYVINQFGGPEVFSEKEMPKPEITENQVLIEVRATSVNPLDYFIRQGVVPYFTHAFPAILHADVAGIIVEKGGAVSQFQIGEEVYACAGGVRGRQGALAQYMSADADFVAKKPKNLNFTQAAALPLISITAWEALVDSANLKPDQRVLIYGATGGVGHIAVQLAKHIGAHVTAVVSSEAKATLAKSLGADQCVFASEFLQDFDVVFDTVGGENLEKAFNATKPYGTVVTIAARGTFNMLPAFGKALKVHFVNMSLPLATGKGMARQGKILRHICKMAEERKIKPVLAERIFKFSEVAQAHAYAQARTSPGKVCLKWE